MARAGRVVAGIDIGNSTTEAVLLEKLDGETYPEPLPKDVKPEIW